MDSENIMKNVYNDVMRFLKIVLGADKVDIVKQQLNKFYPSWADLWKVSYEWLLKEHSLTNMQYAIKSFAQLFPNYDSFANALDDSLEVHEDFWKRVHMHLSAAQQGVKC